MAKPYTSLCKDLCGLGAISAVTFYLLWPAMWVDPIANITRVVTEAIGYAKAGHDSAIFFNGIIYPNGEIPSPYFYPISFLWRTTPLTLLGLVVLFFNSVKELMRFPSSHPIRQRQPGWHFNSLFENRDVFSGVPYLKWTLIGLLLLSIAFGALMTLGLKKFDRYLLPSMVPLDLLAGVGLTWLVGWISKSALERWRISLAALLFFGFILVQATFAWKASPYFFNYYNPLLGGSTEAMNVMQIGWGEGLDQAARYINNKPNSKRYG